MGALIRAAASTLTLGIATQAASLRLMQNSVSIDSERPWELLVASYIAVNMAFLNLATLLGSTMRLVRGPHSFLSMLDVVLGYAMVAIAFATAYWTLIRLRRSIAGYVALVFLLALQMALYPQLPDTTGVAFIEVAFASVGFVVYVVPLILLFRVRGILRS